MRKFLMVLAGVLLISFSAFQAAAQSRQEVSPLDEVAPAGLSSPAGGALISFLQIAGTNAAYQAASPSERESDRQEWRFDRTVALTVTPEQMTELGRIPDRIVVERIGLDAPVIAATMRQVEFEGATYDQWVAPDEFAAGWHPTSARLGVKGNTVLNGHHNVHGMVFEKIVYLITGDVIQVYSEGAAFNYIVDTVLVVPERFKTIEERLENARWIETTEDERLTLITCWPPLSNTHRVIVVAFPAP